MTPEEFRKRYDAVEITGRYKDQLDQEHTFEFTYDLDHKWEYHNDLPIDDER